MSYHAEGAEWRNKPIDPNSNIDERQLKLVEMLLDGEKTKGEIAEILGIHRNTVTRWLRDDRVKALLAEREAEKIRQTNSFFISKAPAAAYKLWEMASTTKDKRVAREIFTYIVDRAVGKPSAKMTIDGMNQEQTEDFDINAALQRINGDKKPAPLQAAKAV